MDDVEWAVDQLGMRQLEVFFKVAETNSFSRAAEALDLRQPTVSNHIKELEDVFDHKLILRENDSLKLTPLGRVCYEKLRSVEAAKEDFRQAVYKFFESNQGEIRLGASTIPGEVLLPRILPDFHDEFESVSIQLEVKDSSKIVQRVRDADLRYGVIGKRLSDSSLKTTCLYEDEMVLVGCKQFQNHSPVNIEDLPNLRYVGRLPGSGTLEAIEDFFNNQGHDADKLLNRVARLETVQAVKEAVLNGLGVSFLPLSVAYPDMKKGNLVSLECTFRRVRRCFYGVTNRFIGLSPLLRKFEEFLVTTWEDKACSDG